MRVYFGITRKQVIHEERMNGREKEHVQVTHASYTINVPLNNFNIHQHNKKGIYPIGYQHYCHTSYYIKSPLYPNSTDMLSKNFL